MNKVTVPEMFIVSKGVEKEQRDGTVTWLQCVSGARNSLPEKIAVTSTVLDRECGRPRVLAIKRRLVTGAGGACGHGTERKMIVGGREISPQ